MHMETMNCGYLSNTTLPQQSPDLYAPTEYATPVYADTQYPDKFPRDDQNNNNNRFSFSDTISEEYDLDDSLSSQMSGMDLYESSETTKPSRRRHSKKSSTSSSCSEKDSNRKDSFVYDVRLPDEQYLFFVPDLDLVKSHLMFAVREEVEVLKEKIGELMEKITTLECENTVLRQYAPPDALLQMQQAPQQQNLPSNLPHHTSS